jgi:hypothetical protein
MDKCPKCNGTGFVPTNVFGVNGAIKCDFCDGTGVFITNAVEPITNEEWFCGLSTDEKTDKLTDFSFWLVPNYPTEDKREQIRKKIELWLKNHTWF